MQALKAEKVHQYFQRFERGSAGGGVLRFTVLGETRLVLCALHTVAAALNKATFLPRARSICLWFYVLVRYHAAPVLPRPALPSTLASSSA